MRNSGKNWRSYKIFEEQELIEGRNAENRRAPTARANPSPPSPPPARAGGGDGGDGLARSEEKKKDEEEEEEEEEDDELTALLEANYHSWKNWCFEVVQTFFIK